MSEKRLQSLSEEIANSITHGLGVVGALIATPFLIMAGIERGTAAVIGACVFSLSLILMYLSSTIYHAVTHHETKQLLRVVDHSAIFLLIAGTYTPFTLGVLKGAWGWTLFALVWGIAVLGISLKVSNGVGHPRLSTALYIGMGWLALIAVRPLWQRLPLHGWIWLAAGGLAYTGGVVFYNNHKLKYSHTVLHLCVLGGSVCHFFAVLWYAM